MRYYKKLIAIILVVACCLQPSILGIANGTDYSIYENSDKIASAIAALRTNTHLSDGYAIDTNNLAPGKIFIEATENGVKSDTKGDFNPAGTQNEGYANSVFDGDINSAADVKVRANGKILCHLDENRNFKENTYVDISTRLKYQANIDRIFIALRDSRVHFQASEYEIYAANSYEDLYNPSNRYFYYENKNGAQFQVFDFDNPVSVQYIGIRILKGVTLPYPENLGVDTSYARLSEIAIFGNYTDPNYVYESIVNQAAINECIEDLTSDYNLMQSGYHVSSNDAPSSIIISGVDVGVPTTQYGTFNSFDHGQANNGVFDGNLVSRADVNLNSPISGKLVTVDSSRNSKANTYIDISICLTYSAKVDKVFISNHSKESLMTHNYAVFTSNSRATLYDKENEQYHYVNTLKKQRQVIRIDNSKYVKYVGIRIYEAVGTPFTAYEPANAYPRFEEIAVFGKYDLEYYDYTVSANVEGVISVNDITYSGREKTYSVPLTKNDKIFKEWQIDGSVTDSEINQYEGISTIRFTPSKNIDVQAIYEDTPKKLSSKIYGIDNDKAWVRIPENELFHTASINFNTYRGSVEAISNGAKLLDGDYITVGTKFRITDNADSELTAVIECDYDSNGKVEVTDIVAAIDGITSQGHNESALFNFDADSSGNITVTDVVLARKTILNSANYDVTEKKFNISEIHLKTMGRTALEEDGSLYLDFSATGFSFNAFCYGEVKIDIKNSGWVTVLVDGKESIMKIGGNTITTATIAKNLSAGVHKIEIYKQNEGNSPINIYAVTLNGEVLDAPKNSDLLIEFIGDSITCGYGNTVPNGTLTTARPTDGYMSYGTQTARLLGADWSNVSKSSATLVNVDGMKNPHAPTFYKQIGYSKPDLYGFEKTADIVVINLGTNDSGILRNMTDEQKKEHFLTAARELVQFIIDKNGSDTKIVFAFGMMTNPNIFDEAYIELAAELQENNIYAFYCRLPTDRTGLSDHPTIAGDTDAARVLADFISDNILK